MMSHSARLASVIAFALIGAPMIAGEHRPVSLVPWKVIEPGTLTDAPLTLFWIPASGEELRRSELLTSHELTLDSARCVAMRVVRFDDLDRLAALEVTSLPVAVLVEGEDRVIGRVDGESAGLPVGEVEGLVGDALQKRESEAEVQLDEARGRADAEDLGGALALYRSVWEQRCLCPRQGREAQRAMRRIKKLRKR